MTARKLTLSLVATAIVLTTRTSEALAPPAASSLAPLVRSIPPVTAPSRRLDPVDVRVLALQREARGPWVVEVDRASARLRRGYGTGIRLLPDSARTPAVANRKALARQFIARHGDSSESTSAK